MSKVTVMNHPLIQHKIGIMRVKDTSTKEFRDLVSEIAMLICYEATRELHLADKEIETPLEKTTVKEIAGKKLCIVPILRAGLHMVEYFCKLPKDADERDIFVVDPMLATGGSAIAAINRLKARGIKSIRFLCLIAAPEGVKALEEAHPDIDIYIGAIDRQLNENGYILPGLGDAGDRIYGTK